MEIQSYFLPAHWASALINDDATGLTDDEHNELNDWLLDYKPGHCLSVSENPEFCTWHDARDAGVLPCECLEFSFEEVAA